MILAVRRFIETRIRLVALAATVAALGACATVSAASRVERELVALGLNTPQAECIAEELAEDLDRGDLSAVADFLADLNRASSPGGALDALLRIDNPRAAAAAAGAGVSCALVR